MIIITGLGRCGTSVLTKFLGELGFGLGQNVKWHTDARAGLELSTAYTITTDLYHRFLKKGKEIDLSVEAWGDYWKGFTYRDAINAVDKDERQGKVEVIKDPRLTWHPDLIKAWWSVRQDFKLIICHRKIEDIMKSRKSLPETFKDPKPSPHPSDLKKGTHGRIKLEDYQIDFAEFFTRVIELGIPYRILYFPNFLFDFGEVFSLLHDLDMPFDLTKGKEIWDELIER